MKEKRVKMILDLIVELQGLKKKYLDASPAWILIQATQGHLKAIHLLETETKLGEHILGGKNE